jgi:hypothetical protein
MASRGFSFSYGGKDGGTVLSGYIGFIERKG